MSGKMQAIRDSLRDARVNAGYAWEDMTPLRRRLVVSGGVAVVVLLAIGLFLLLRPGAQAPPPTDDAEAVARFLATPRFKQLPAEQKLPYMKAARKQMKQIEAQTRAGTIDRQTYRTAYIFSRLARKLEDMSDYYAQPAARRQAYMDAMLKPDAPPRPAGAAGGTTKPSSTDRQDPSAQPDDHSLLWTDEQQRVAYEALKDDLEDDYFDTATPQAKQQWKDFRAAYTERRAQLERTGAR